MLITLISLRKREWLLHHKNNWNFIFISRFILDGLEYQSGFFVFFFSVPAGILNCLPQRKIITPRLLSLVWFSLCSSLLESWNISLYTDVLLYRSRQIYKLAPQANANNSHQIYVSSRGGSRIFLMGRGWYQSATKLHVILSRRIGDCITANSWKASK